MPTNIQTITQTCDLPSGTYRMLQIDAESDAAYYAGGKTAYFFRSVTIKAMYLFIPVIEVPA